MDKHDHDANGVTRRQLLVLVAGGVAVASGSALASACAHMQAQPVDAGLASDLAVNTCRRVMDVIVCRDNLGIYAWSAICSYDSSLLAAPADGSTQSVCPGDSSVFDREGNVQSGPATIPQAHFAVSVDASGHIIVDTGNRLADRTTRTMG
jgi:nitrite reductase/ring-hydroxylating ferredoxin subunit